MFFLVFAFLIAAAPVKAGLADGGSECSYRLDYVEVETDRRAFSARITFNATGYFSVTEAYRVYEDGEMGVCARPGAMDEIGVKSFYLDDGRQVYTLDEDLEDATQTMLVYAHFPIGIKYHQLGPIDQVFERFFDYFGFNTVDGEYYACCPSVPCRCVCSDDREIEAVRTFCVANIAPLNCTTQNITAPVTAILTMHPDGDVDVEGENSDWYAAYPWIFSNGTDRHATVVRDEIIFRDQFDVPVNYSTAMCSVVGGCIFIRPNGQISTEIFMGPALGQAQRLVIEIDYWNMPESKDGFCVYFDYLGLDTNSAFPSVPRLYKVWCGGATDYDALRQTIRLELPFTYGPAFSGVDYIVSPTDGSSRSRPLVIETRGQSSVVFYDVRLYFSGEAYHCVEREWPARRNANEGAEPWWWQGVKIPGGTFSLSDLFEVKKINDV